MKTERVDFSRVPDRSVNPDATTRTGPTITVSTVYDPEHSRYETAARRDGKTPALCGPWVIVDDYGTKDAALAGHIRWRDAVRDGGVPSVDMFGNAV